VLNDLAIAKSWVRATALTPLQDFDPKAAADKLTNEFGLPLVEEALKSLRGSKVLMNRSNGRATPGRSYEATDLFHRALRKPIDEERFKQAAEFKRNMDQVFRSGKSVRAEQNANDGAVMCISSLIATGRATLVPTGIPKEPFGLMDGGYEARFIPQEKFHFHIDVAPTELYIYDDDNEFLSSFAAATPPRGGQRGEIPAWYGSMERLILDLWKKILVAVSQTVTLRTGITMSELTRIFKPALEEWELKYFMDWGTELGLFKRVHRSIEGWEAGEWWWLAVGRLCAGFEEVL